MKEKLAVAKGDDVAESSALRHMSEPQARPQGLCETKGLAKSLLVQFLGESPTVKIIDFLIENKGIDYSKKDVIEGSEVSRASLFKNWDRFEKFGIVRVTRSFGKTKLYTLNTESETVQKLLQLEANLIKQAMDDAYQSSAESKPVLIPA